VNHFRTKVGEIDNRKIVVDIGHIIRDHFRPAQGRRKQRGMIAGVFAFIDGGWSGTGTERVSVLRSVLRRGLGLGIAVRVDGGVVVLIGVRIRSCLALDLFIAEKTIYSSSPLSNPGFMWRWAMMRG
jgi:hypothetical protein